MWLSGLVAPSISNVLFALTCAVGRWRILLNTWWPSWCGGGRRGRWRSRRTGRDIPVAIHWLPTAISAWKVQHLEPWIPSHLPLRPPHPHPLTTSCPIPARSKWWRLSRIGMCGTAWGGGEGQRGVEVSPQLVAAPPQALQGGMRFSLQAGRAPCRRGRSFRARQEDGRERSPPLCRRCRLWPAAAHLQSPAGSPGKQPEAGHGRGPVWCSPQHNRLSVGLQTSRPVHVEVVDLVNGPLPRQHMDTWMGRQHHGLFRDRTIGLSRSPAQSRSHGGVEVIEVLNPRFHTANCISFNGRCTRWRQGACNNFINLKIYRSSLPEVFIGIGWVCARCERLCLCCVF